jgi:transposase
VIDYREILRLTSLNYSRRTISSCVGSSRNTVSETIDAANAVGIAWPQCESMTNEDLSALLFPGKVSSSDSRFLPPDCAYIHREMAKPGVTLTLLWTEYCAKAKDVGLTPYQYTQFGEKYRKWAKLTKATMRVQHKPGDAMQVDWAGNTIPVFDPVTGDESKAYLFVCVLPYSCYAYAEACDDMRTENWLGCHAHAYSYFGGVTRLLVPDNLKTGVVANTKYETLLNRSYQEMAEHYDTAIVPTRVRHPKDKSLAEGTVSFASTWIIAALRNQKFFSIEEVKSAVAERLDVLNTIPFKKREGCRREAYLNEEQEFMKPLPSSPYELACWSSAKVGYDYLVSDGKNKYSVPYDLIGENVDIRLTKNTVEVFFKGSRVASHLREKVAKRDPIIHPEHMTPEHRKYLNYNADDFTTWAASIGSKTAEIVDHFLNSGKEVEQGFKSCASLTKLASRYGDDRIESACSRVLDLTSSPSIRSITTILKSMRDGKSTAASAPTNDNSYGITRGADYFSKGGTKYD